MTKKLCLLTGATSGIGQAAAISLAEQGYDLYLAARSEAKAAATTKRIMSKVPDASVNWLYGDLSKLDDVRSLAKEFLSVGQAIDLLWLNAGLCYNKRVLTPDGYEMMWAVNHLAPFLLTHLLFDKLCEGDHDTRGAYSFVDRLNLEDVNYDNGFKTMKTYGNSKLANILFTQTLARKLQDAAPDKTFTVNCFHPGFVGTGIGTQVLLGKILMTMLKPFTRSSAKGAETGLRLATDPVVEGKMGGYYYDCELQKLKAYARDEVMAQALWDKSLEMVG